MPTQPPEAPLLLRLKHMREGFTVLASFFAMTVTPPLRIRQGYNMLQPGAALVMTGVMLLFNALMNFQVAVPLIGRVGAHETSDALWYYAFAFLGFALWNRRARWKELLRGERWHSYSRGVSRLESFVPLRQDLIYRIADPAAAFLGGALLRKLGVSALGLWFEIGGVCLYLVENYAYEIALDRDLAILDSLLESDVAAATAEHFTAQEEGQAKSRSIRDTGGIATGADAGLEAVIARRKKEAAGGAA